MSNLYNRIDALCKNRNVSITIMCKDAGVSRASLSDLKMGRNQSLSADTLSKIATYFAVSVDYLLGKEKAPAVSGERIVSEEEKTPPTEPQLSEGEEMLLSLFRQIPKEQQGLVVQMIRAALGK